MLRHLLISLLAGQLVGQSPTVGGRSDFDPEIPRTWDEAAIASIEIPLPHPGFSPKHVEAAYYEAIPVRPIYKTYPIYHPDHEPEGYWERLHTVEPEVAFDPSELRSREDWIRAGEFVFDDGGAYSTGSALAAVRDRDWYTAVKVPLTPRGIMPFGRYVVREKGRVEIETDACSVCHTRVQPDGSIIKGGPGNFPLGRSLAYEHRKMAKSDRELRALAAGGRDAFFRSARARWLDPDPNGRILTMSGHELLGALSAMPPGVQNRNRTSLLFPVRVPDLIGVANRRYLDATGLVRHRSIGDFMRYAALNQGAEGLADYGGYLGNGRPVTSRPPPDSQTRMSDAALYALALYVYSLEPPANPNPFDDAARRGREIFGQQRCDRCHAAPSYTNNKLMPVAGFDVPPDHRKRFRVHSGTIRTDSALTLHTRRGTGYYKVPSLLGVWYRGPFGHDGAVLTLEEWFDPARLRADYQRSGYRGPFKDRHAVPGHPYGLRLSPRERGDLIAFLRTL